MYMYCMYNIHISIAANELTYVSSNDSLISVTMADCGASVNLNTLSMTDNSVLVVSNPQKALQSLTTIPAPMTSLPLLTVPAYNERLN